MFQIHIVKIRLDSVRSDSTLNTGLMNESTVATIKLSFALPYTTSRKDNISIKKKIKFRIPLNDLKLIL